MNKFLFILFVSFSAFAWDSTPGNFTGKYVITHSEACVKYLLYYSCVEIKELDGKFIEVVQSKINDSDVVCIHKNFKDEIKGQTCYKNSAEENTIVKITGSGFTAEFNDIRYGESFAINYAKFSRSGLEYQLKDGGSVKGLHMFYIFTLEKAKH